MATVDYNGKRWWDNGVSSHGKDKQNALKYASHMRKGGFDAAIVKRPDGWHVLSKPEGKDA